jgi:hypothetical protein
VATEESWWQEIASAARAERAEGSRVGKDLQTLVEVAEVLAGTLARTTLGRLPELATVTATLIANRAPGEGMLSARLAMAPTFRGEGPTRELDTTVEVVDSRDRLVGDVHFAWTARSGVG